MIVASYVGVTTGSLLYSGRYNEFTMYIQEHSMLYVQTKKNRKYIHQYIEYCKVSVNTNSNRKTILNINSVTEHD